MSNRGAVSAWKSGDRVVIYTVQAKPDDLHEEAHIKNTYHEVPVSVREIDAFIGKLQELRDVIVDQQNYNPSKAAREKAA